MRGYRKLLDFLREKTTNSSFFTVPNDWNLPDDQTIDKKAIPGDMVAYTGAELLIVYF